MVVIILSLSTWLMLQWSCSVIVLLIIVLFGCTGQSGEVFSAQEVDFMKDVIDDGEYTVL